MEILVERFGIATLTRVSAPGSWAISSAWLLRACVMQYLLRTVNNVYTCDYLDNDSIKTI